MKQSVTSISKITLSCTPRNDERKRHCEPFDCRSRQVKVKQSSTPISEITLSFTPLNDVTERHCECNEAILSLLM